MESKSVEKAKDLYERCLRFATNCANSLKKLPRTTSNLEYRRQLIRSSGSVGANYIEAWESSGKKDFVYRLKICRKEAKESGHWIRLIIETNTEVPSVFKDLFQESKELVKIFSKSIGTSVKRLMI